MKNKARATWMIVLLSIMLPVMSLAQSQIQTLVVSGYAGSIPVSHGNGRNYVDLEALARVVNGSLSFSGSQVTLTLSTAGGNSAPAEPPPPPSGPVTTAAFSPDFLRAGIEAMSTIREWHSALASAIENNYPVTQGVLAPYQSQAMTNLRLAQTAAATPADQKAAQIVTNEYQKMNQLSEKYVAKRANMSYVGPDALKNDPLNQSIIACGRALGSMAASGQFTSTAACQ